MMLSGIAWVIERGSPKLARVTVMSGDEYVGYDVRRDDGAEAWRPSTLIWWTRAEAERALALRVLGREP